MVDRRLSADASVAELEQDKAELQDRVDVLAREVKELKRQNHQLGVEAEAAKANTDDLVAEAVKDATETLRRRHYEQSKSEQQAHARAAGASAKRIAELEDEVARATSALKLANRRKDEETSDLVAQNRALQVKGFAWMYLCACVTCSVFLVFSICLQNTQHAHTHAQDELDVAAEKAKKLAQAEVTLARYKQKLEAANSMRDQLKYKQESNSSSLERIAELVGTAARFGYAR